MPSTCREPQDIFIMALFSSSLEWFPALLLVLFLPLLSLFLLKRKKKGMEEANLPPSPPRLPIIGNLHQLGKLLPHRSLWKLSQTCGQVMLLQLGSMPTLVISSADMAKEFFKTHDVDSCSRPPSSNPKRFSYNFLDVAFSPYTDCWREMRKVFVSELLSLKRVNSFWYAREAEVNRLITSLTQASPNAVNLSEKILTLVNGIIGTVAFGTIYGGKQFKDHKFQDVVDEALNLMGSFSAEDLFPSVGPILDVLTGRRARLEKGFRKLDGYFQMVLDDHLDPARPKPDYEDLVDSLLGLSEEQTGAFLLTKDHVKAILMNTIVGGIDTSFITLVWAMAELARSPRVMQKVQAEIRSCIGRKPKVERDDIGNLTYLKMVVKETLRMHPPAPLLVPHETIRHCKIGGYDIYPKTRVLVNSWAIGMDPNNWKNPNEFYPERFEANDIDFKGHHFELLPFGAGRRICPAITAGTTTVEFTLANLLYCFDWELPSGVKREEDISMEEEGGFTVHKKTPLWLVPIRYNGRE